MRVHRLFVTTTLALAASFNCSPLSAQPIINPMPIWSPATDGMRMAISVVKPGIATQQDIEFYLAFQNIGSKDFVLNLGMMLGNGKVQEPDAIRLMLTDPNGQTREFQCSKVPAIGGRVDDFLAALPVGATYVLKLNLNQYCCIAPVVKLTAGRYRIAAQFKGRGAQFVSLDTPGIRLLNFWTGSVQTKFLEFEIADRRP